LDFRPGLVEDQNIEPKTLGELDAGKHLLTPIKVRNFRGMRPARERFAVRQQVHIFAHRQRRRTDLAFGGRDPERRLVASTAIHRLGSVAAWSVAIRRSKCAPAANSMHSRAPSCQCATATETGMPRSQPPCRRRPTRRPIHERRN